MNITLFVVRKAGRVARKTGRFLKSKYKKGGKGPGKTKRTTKSADIYK